MNIDYSSLLDSYVNKYMSSRTIHITNSSSNKSDMSEKINKTKKNEFRNNRKLWRVLFRREFLIPYAMMVLMRVAMVLIGYLPSYLTDQYLGKLSRFYSNIDLGISWIYIQAIIIISVLYIQSFLGEFVENYKYSSFLGLKVHLNCLLVDKSLRMQVIDSAQSTPSNFINVLTQDIQRLENGLRSLIDTMALVLDLVIGILYLHAQISGIDISLKGLLGLVVLLMLGNISLVGVSQLFSLYAQRARDQRVSLLQEVFNGMRAIKTLSLEAVFLSKVEKTRKKEFTSIKVIRTLDAIFNSLIRSFGVVIMLVLSLFSQGKDIQMDMFSGLVLINQLVYPITAFPWSIGSAIGLIFPYMRLQSLLNSAEVKEEFVNIDKSKENMRLLEIRDLEFKYKNSKNASLRIKELSVSPGELVVISGANGSGKTTLLRLITHELSYSKGLMSVRAGPFSYVAQDIWLLNAGIKDNVTLDMNYIQSQYVSCLKKCCLEGEVMEKGDSFLIGLNGNRLSGGQRQRLSLCRAMYQDNELFLLDDVFSALDEQVANEIFREYVINGLINRGKGVILTTTQSKFSKYATRTYEIKEGCDLVEVSKDSVTIFNRTDSQKETNLGIKDEAGPTEPISGAGDHEVNSKISKSPFDENGIKRYLRAIGGNVVVMVIVSALVHQASKHYCEIYFNGLLTSGKDSQGKEALVVAGIYLGLTLLRGLSYSTAVLRAAERFFREILSKIIAAKVEFFEDYQPGELISFLTRDFDSIDCNLPEDFNGWASSMVNIVGIFGVFCFEFPVMIILCWELAKRTFRLYRTHSQENKQQRERMKACEAKRLDEVIELSQ